MGIASIYAKVIGVTPYLITMLSSEECNTTHRRLDTLFCGDTREKMNLVSLAHELSPTDLEFAGSPPDVHSTYTVVYERATGMVISTVYRTSGDYDIVIKGRHGRYSLPNGSSLPYELVITLEKSMLGDVGEDCIFFHISVSGEKVRLIKQSEFITPEMMDVANAYTPPQITISGTLAWEHAFGATHCFQGEDEILGSYVEFRGTLFVFHCDAATISDLTKYVTTTRAVDCTIVAGKRAFMNCNCEFATMVDVKHDPERHDGVTLLIDIEHNAQEQITRCVTAAIARNQPYTGTGTSMHMRILIHLIPNHRIGELLKTIVELLHYQVTVVVGVLEKHRHPVTLSYVHSELPILRAPGFATHRVDIKRHLGVAVNTVWFTITTPLYAPTVEDDLGLDEYEQ